MRQTRERRLVDKAAIALLKCRVRITASLTLGRHFRIITLEGASLRRKKWVPGQRILVLLDSENTSRSYTPLDWDVATGWVRILIYAYGQGPGSNWARTAKIGDQCSIIGPRASLDTTALNSTAILIGDETSFGLAYALQHHLENSTFRSLFEVNDPDDVDSAFALLGLRTAGVLRRLPNDTHLDAIEERLPNLSAEKVHFILTGKGRTVQRLRQALKTLNVPINRITTSAYWADGKQGLE